VTGEGGVGREHAQGRVKLDAFALVQDRAAAGAAGEGAPDAVERVGSFELRAGAVAVARDPEPELVKSPHGRARSLGVRVAVAVDELRRRHGNDAEAARTLEQRSVGLHVADVLDPMAVIATRQFREGALERVERHRSCLASGRHVQPELEPGLVRLPDDLVQLFLRPLEIDHRLPLGVDARPIDEELDPAHGEPLVAESRLEPDATEFVDGEEPRDVVPEAEPRRQLAAAAELLERVDSFGAERNLADRGDAARLEERSSQLPDRLGCPIAPVARQRQPVPQLGCAARFHIERRAARQRAAVEETGHLERLRVERADVQAREDDGGVRGHGLVEVGPKQRAAFLHPALEAEVRSPDDPVSRRRLARAGAERALDVSERSVRRCEAADLVCEVRRRQLEVAVRVDEAGQHDATLEVEPVRVGRKAGVDLPGVADGNNATAPGDEAGGNPAASIHRHDATTEECCRRGLHPRAAYPESVDSKSVSPRGGVVSMSSGTSRTRACQRSPRRRTSRVPSSRICTLRRRAPSTQTPAAVGFGAPTRRESAPLP
jgi:hypothetical protein